MPIVRKRLNPVHDTPPKIDEKHTKEKQQLICLICEVEFIESSDDVLGDDAVYFVKTARVGYIINVYGCQNCFMIK